MNDYNGYPPIKQIKSIRVSACFGQATKEYTISAPRVIKTTLCLTSKGTKGLTSLEASSWAYRLSAYVYTLRHDYGMDIPMTKEPHDGGWHARYILNTPVTVLNVTTK